MGLVHGQIHESNARTQLWLHGRVADHVAWNPMQERDCAHNRVPALDSCIEFHATWSASLSCSRNRVRALDSWI